MIRVLSAFPIEIAQRVCDPLTGIPSTIRWLPTVSEVREACDAMDRSERRAREREEQIKQQLEERARAEADRLSRPTGEELRAKYGENFGLDPMPDDPEPDPSERSNRARRFSQRCIEREYAALGQEPAMCGEFIVSPELVRSVR